MFVVYSFYFFCNVRGRLKYAMTPLLDYAKLFLRLWKYGDELTSYTLETGVKIIWIQCIPSEAYKVLGGIWVSAGSQLWFSFLRTQQHNRRRDQIYFISLRKRKVTFVIILEANSYEMMNLKKVIGSMYSFLFYLRLPSSNQVWTLYWVAIKNVLQMPSNLFLFLTLLSLSLLHFKVAFAVD